MLANLSDFLADPLEAPDFLQKKKFDKNFPGAVLASLTRLWNGPLLQSSDSVYNLKLGRAVQYGGDGGDPLPHQGVAPRVSHSLFSEGEIFSLKKSYNKA